MLWTATTVFTKLPCKKKQQLHLPVIRNYDGSGFSFSAEHLPDRMEKKKKKEKVKRGFERKKATCEKAAWLRLSMHAILWLFWFVFSEGKL